MVLPARFRNREDRDRARALLARKMLWELLAAARSQLGPLRWINEGGLEAEEFLECERPPSTKTIEHWQDRQPLRSPSDEQTLANGIHASRIDEPGGRARLIDYFIGIAHAALTPGTLVGVPQNGPSSWGRGHAISEG
jgi:hypothetical protein